MLSRSGTAMPQCVMYLMHGSSSAVPQVRLSSRKMCLLSRLPDASRVPALLNARAATCDIAMKMTQLPGRLQGSSHKQQDLLNLYDLPRHDVLLDLSAGQNSHIICDSQLTLSCACQVQS